MAQKILHYATWFWEDYTGAKWNNVNVANGGEGLGSYVHPQGYNSKTAYKPKSLFYHYRVGGLDRTKHKIDDVNFRLYIRKFNPNENDLPTIKVFVGDNNAPYTKSPIKVVKDYTRLKNDYWYDNYTLNYSLKGVTFDDLKNLIIEVDWSKTKVSYATTISVNRGKLFVDYSLKTPKWSLYDTVNKTTATTNDTIAWKLTAKNTGECGTGRVQLQLPKGVTVSYSTGEGTYNNTTKVWTFNACKGQSEVRTFYLKSSSVGLKNLTAINDSPYATNLNLIRQVSFIKYVQPVIPSTRTNRDDIITYTFYDTFEKESDQFFDVQIQGMKENHPNGGACYTITTSNNVELNTPLRTNVELLDGNTNIKELVTDSTVTYGDITVQISDNAVCFKLDRTTDDFVANIRVYMYCTDDTTGSVTTSANGKSKTGTFDILPMRGNKFFVEESISRDKSYVVNSVNIGSPSVWTINSKAHRHNFFDEKKDLMEIEIEEAIAYIGVIPLSRCHKADVTATSKNSLIENRYLNRAYYGKKGDYDEDIKMTLRMAWQDVATLQGLCEMDKPIPIDTIPNRADGDPLNHRGWAEIYEVSNIKKINDMFYECDVGVKYLTHDILTKFNIKEAKKITEASIKYYLSLIHNYNDDLLDLFKLNYYEFWTTLEDVNGDKTGSYNIEPNTSLIMNRDLNKNSTYDIVWRNSLPSLMSEDYDGNWEMALRVLNKTDRTTLFEHSYNGYQHYDFDNAYAVNTANAETKMLDSSNNYQTLNYEKINLGYDGLAPLIENRKISTHFNTMENITISDPTEQFEIFLLDKDNVGVGNQIVRVKVTGDDNFTNGFNVITDRYGRLLFNVDWGNGTYNISLTFDETDTYNGCTYNTNVQIQFNYVEYHFSYPTNTPTYINDSNYYTCVLLDSNEDEVTGVTVHYSWKTLDGDYGHEETVMSNENGVISIPIVRPTGSHMLRVNFKGFTDNGTVYQPSQFESQINVLNDREETIIEADDMTIIQGDSEREYSIVVKDKLTGTPLSFVDVKIAFYNNDETFILSTQTNNYGVASVPMYLKGGAWKVDSVFGGSANKSPCIVTRTATTDNFVQTNTYIVCENITLNEDKVLNGEQDFFSFHLFDEYDNGVVREPVNVKIYNATGETLYIDTTFRTRGDGKVVVPFLSHSENVIVEITYKGGVKYTASTNSCIISFETVINKTEQTLSQSTKMVTERGTGIIKEQDNINLTIGGVLQENYYSKYAILNNEDNERLTTDDPMVQEFVTYYGYPLISNETLPKGNYKLTVFEWGDDTKYSICRTFTGYWVNSSLVRLAVWVDMQEAEEEIYYEILNDATKVGDYAHIRFTLDFWITDGSLATVKSGYVNNNGNITYDKEYYATTNETVDENGRRVTYFDIYGILTAEQTWRIDFSGCNPVPNFYEEVEISADSSTKSAITVSQTGFAYDNETYQDLQIDINDSDGTIQYDTGFYIIKLFDMETWEEMYYYSYIYDNLQPSRITFPLTKSIKESGNNWNMDILVNHSDTLKGGYYHTSGRIDTDTVIVTETTSIFTSEDDYIQLDDTVTFTDNGFQYGGGA